VSGIVKSPSRNRRARGTQRRVVDAAAELFVAEGYASTTLEQIARRAGVSVQTVYFHFGNKRTVLKQAVDVAAVGDDEPVPLLERPWFMQLQAEPDPRRCVAIWMETSREIMERIGPIMGVVRDAADADPDMAAQWATNQEQTAHAFRMFAGLLDQRAALRVPVDEATDILCALLSLEVYMILVRRGWSPQRWQRWGAEMITAALLE
jgi:AcrR family transcriptional regulator